jgi:hypothetical protein
MTFDGRYRKIPKLKDEWLSRHEAPSSEEPARPWIEEPAGWSETVGLAAETKLLGLDRVGAQFTFNLAANNLVRLPKLLAA